MASKLLVATWRPWTMLSALCKHQNGTSPLPPKNIFVHQIIIARNAGQMLPPSQYDIPFSKKLKPGHAIFKNWEVIPLFFVTFTAMALMVMSIIWAIGNKVDVVYRPSTRAHKNISRTMNLHNPTYHKLIIINQKYEPWPEMTNLIRKLNLKECKENIKASTCLKEGVKRYKDGEVYKFEASTRTPTCKDEEYMACEEHRLEQKRKKDAESNICFKCGVRKIISGINKIPTPAYFPTEPDGSKHEDIYELDENTKNEKGNEPCPKDKDTPCHESCLNDGNNEPCYYEGDHTSTQKPSEKDLVDEVIRKFDSDTNKLDQKNESNPKDQKSKRTCTIL